MGHAGWGSAPGWVATIRAYLPRGNTLDEETFRRRHLLLCWVLGLHIPSLVAFGIWRGYSLGDSLVELTTPTVCLVLARVVHNRRLAAFFVTAGLVFCSSVLVHQSGGMIEAHFHFFILIGLIALYQDWVPFLWNVVFTVLSHGVGSAMDPTSMFNHHAGINKPWLWAVIHGVSVLAACTGLMIFWKNTEYEQQRASALAVDLSSAELAAVQAEAAQRRSTADLLVNLARRNQSLLNRQLTLIAELEQRERNPEALSDLFQLDHLATRIRRNAESLLVLSGDDPPRLWGRPMPLSEVVRAAAAEVEDYGRVDVLVNDYIEITGRAVADLAHLLAELIENATSFSPPGSGVRVRSHLAPSSWSTFMVSIEDTGIGMSDADLEAANDVLSEPRDVDLGRSTLGFHVVSRLARRYGLEVRVAPTPGGGLTALVTLPNDLASERREPLPPPQPVPPPLVPAALGPAPTPALATESSWTASPTPEALYPVAATPPAYIAPAALPAADPGSSAPPAPGADDETARAPTAEFVVPGLTPAEATHTADGFERRVPGARLGDDAREPEPTYTADGLVRRVPGAGLAAALRRDDGTNGTPQPNGGDAAPAEALDREQVRSMLSQFQAGQRAGRAVADLQPPEEEAP